MITRGPEETIVGPVQDLHLKAKEPEVGLELRREGHHGPRADPGLDPDLDRIPWIAEIGGHIVDHQVGTTDLLGVARGQPTSTWTNGGPNTPIGRRDSNRTPP